MDIRPGSALDKTPSGIDGLDEVTGGGLPRSRTTLVCGGTGCGKTLMGLQFLVHGALDHGEPGVLMAFEESTAALTENVASLGWDLDDLVKRELLVIDQVDVMPAEIIESGEWDLEGLILRLGGAIDAVGAKRVVLDTIEVLFGALADERLLRSELRRLFHSLNERRVSAIVTGESGGNTLTRHGLEEYVSDCVIILDQRLIEQTATRRLRIAKYRGSAHGADEYPFLIDDRGVSVLPVTSMAREHRVSTERVSLGVPALDTMLTGGPFRGSSVLVTGYSGSGKSSLAAGFLDAAGSRGERSLLFTFEESYDQILRNMESVGFDLRRWHEQGLLRIVASRPAAYGLERHLAEIHREIASFGPQIVVLDPASALTGEAYEVAAMLSRLVDHMKSLGVTAMLTALVHGQASDAVGLRWAATVVDTWIELTNHEQLGEHNRGVSIIKSRGMKHSAQLREFRLTSEGIEIRSPYASGGELLMGTARQSQEAIDHRARTERDSALDARRRAASRRRVTVEAQIAALRETLESEGDDFDLDERTAHAAEHRRTEDDVALVDARGGGARSTSGSDEVTS